MTNREAHEKAAGMNLCPEFFVVSGINPDAEYKEVLKIEEPLIGFKDFDKNRS